MFSRVITSQPSDTVQPTNAVASRRPECRPEVLSVGETSATSVRGYDQCAYKGRYASPRLYIQFTTAPNEEEEEDKVCAIKCRRPQSPQTEVISLAVCTLFRSDAVDVIPEVDRCTRRPSRHSLSFRGLGYHPTSDMSFLCIPTPSSSVDILRSVQRLLLLCFPFHLPSQSCKTHHQTGFKARPIHSLNCSAFLVVN